MDRKEAFEILGLEDGSSFDTIEKRYGILLRKYHFEAANKDKDVTVDLDKINEAYKLLNNLNYEEHKKVSHNPLVPILHKFFGIFGTDEKKVANVIYYYKFPVLAILIGLAILTSFAVTMITNTNPDLNIAYIGDYRGTVTKSFVEKVEKSLPNVKKVQIQLITIRLDFSKPSLNNEFKKVMVLFGASDLDFVIMDKAVYNYFQNLNAFISLDGFDIDRVKNKNFLFEAKDTGKLSLYGVDLLDNKFLKDDKISGKVKIGAIPDGSRFKENAKEFLKILIK
ncbi:MAG: DnaJ domain-containing protein [Clostridia bacterium]